MTLKFGEKEFGELRKFGALFGKFVGLKDKLKNLYKF